MKKVFFFACFATIGIAAQAKIWRVNNNPGVTADATTAQAAHDMAAAGDTIHLEPSPSQYGGVSCYKPLTWLSVGVFLNENPGNQYATVGGAISYMYLYAGSQGSVVSVYCDSYIYIYSSNNAIVRSYALGISEQSGSLFNTLVTQCYVRNGGMTFYGTSFIATNNICYSIATTSDASGVISNNVFTAPSGGSNIYNSVFQNNISRGVGFSFYNSNASYNMTAAATGLPAGNNNQFNVSMASVFVNDGNYGTPDLNYKLKAGSPAIGIAFGGGDLGAFGGSTPYVLALQPAIPAITALSSPAANSATTIQVTFSAKSNQ